MRVLVVSQWCWPEPNPLSTVFARELAARGHTVTLITGFPNYPTGKVYPGYRLRLWQRERLDNVDILRVWLYPEHSRSGFRRILNYLSFSFSLMTLGLLKAPKVDVMWVYHPPLTVGLAANVLGFFKRVPFLYVVQDLWPESVMASGMVSSPFVESAILRVARAVYRRAGAVAVISPGFEKNLRDKGVPARKLRLVYNWGNDRSFYPCEPPAGLAASLGLAGKFNVIFAGNMGFAQNLQTVIEAAALMADVPDVQFVFIGDGTDKAGLQQETSRRGIANVRFLGTKPESEMAALLACGDALLVQLRNDPLFSITIPSKTQAYLACGKPVLCGVRGDAAQIIKESGAGVIYDSSEPASLSAAVRTLRAMPAGEREAMGKRGLETYRKNFQLSSVVSCYETILQELAGARHNT
ncbi:MAG TPA: glycosyltransferase family 4 protein [Verrucomicrobiae bacterium]|nr:glycosyltransferase family 4 protein [Verrucomicrobiae bacterium]